jgi:lipopolysaccharide export system permease protein
VDDLRRGAEESLQRYTAERDRDVRDRSLRAYLLEFHWKFAVPAGCLVFAFFAWPVGLRARRSGRSVGFAVGLFVAIVYWGMLVAGRTFGVRLNVPPAAAMWLPDAVVFGSGLVVAVVRPGGRR